MPSVSFGWNFISRRALNFSTNSSEVPSTGSLSPMLTKVGVQGLGPVRMKPVVRQVLHVLHVLHLHAHESQILGVIRKSEAQGIHQPEVPALHGHLDGISPGIPFLIRTKQKRSVHADFLLCLLGGFFFFFSSSPPALSSSSSFLSAFFLRLVGFVFQLGGYHGNIVSVNKAILVDVPLLM